jgi:GWxTD domain-containing protein
MSFSNKIFKNHLTEFFRNVLTLMFSYSDRKASSITTYERSFSTTKITIVTLFLILSLNNLFSQDSLKIRTGTSFYLDAMCFKSEKDSLSRVDVYALVPYQTLDFVKSGDMYGAEYDIVVKAIDTNNKVIQEKRTHRSIRESDYFSTQGGTGKFDYTQTILMLPKGKYEIEALLIDGLNNLTYEKSRSMTVLNFSEFPFALSGIMLVSTIEEDNGKYTITPHISDNVGDLKDGYFAFFEAYNKSGIDSADFVYQLIGKNEIVVDSSQKISRYIKAGVTQLYLKISYNEKLAQGNYTLRIIALKPNHTDSVSASDYLAVSERSIKYFKSLFGFNLPDLSKAIKELRYVASGGDIDNIEAGQTQEEKQRRFEEFWKKLDPTPQTERNEAFEDYYSRIDYADKEFKSYNEGWLTDMGQVYIVYGKPMFIEKTPSYTVGRKYERWTYADNRQFIFVDNTGFGDFRLASPPMVSDKYKYNK